MLQIWSADTRSLDGERHRAGLVPDRPAVRGRAAGDRAGHGDGADRRARCRAALHPLRPRAARRGGRCRGGGDDRRQPEDASTPERPQSRWRSSALPRCSSRCGPRSRPPTGPFQLIYAFEAVIIGGMGSIWGAFIGAMVLGISQSIGFRIDPGLRHPRRAPRLPDRSRLAPAGPAWEGTEAVSEAHRQLVHRRGAAAVGARAAADDLRHDRHG